MDAANRLERSWQSLPKAFSRVNKRSYDVTLSAYASADQWNGIQLLDRDTNDELAKFGRVSTEDYLTFSSLIKSGTSNGHFIYYVNYGQPEDLAYLINQNVIHRENNEKTIVFMRRQSRVMSQTEQIRQAIHHRFAGLVLFDDEGSDQNCDENTATNDRRSFSQEWKSLKTDKGKCSSSANESLDYNDALSIQNVNDFSTESPMTTIIKFQS